MPQKNPFAVYLEEIAKTKVASTDAGTRDLEHQHRPALKRLLETLIPDITALNEPGKIEFGAPDFALLKNRWPVGYVETKRVGEDLDAIAKGEQLKRYFGYSNLILTNYLEFRFYKHGELYSDSISIADVNTLAPDDTGCRLLENTLRDFLQEAAEPVRSAEKLAVNMGEKGKRLRDNLLRFLKQENPKNKPILDIYHVFRDQLIHDLSIEAFTDMYAQTLVYGLFVARYYDKSSKTFSRQEARELIPATNPLLRRFFDHITGGDFDERLKPIVDELCEVFRNAEVSTLMQQLYKQDIWGTQHAGPDPVVHFYEDFLREYDAQQRKKLGAFYTPPPVVRFIVRSVDAILKRDFELAAGLSDTSKTEISRTRSGKSAREQMHRVQVLDPATGTGTFLSEAIRLIRSSFVGQEGRFPQYVNDDLLPRVHGFELMMAPYTIAHLKIGSTLAESGAKDLKTRLGIYLTNSLEEGVTDDGSLFGALGLSQAISNEAREASVIKKDTPIMVVIGNPPYSVSSNNPSIVIGADGKKRKTWIGELIDDYKKDLHERKINLDDDYIKFIRLSEHFVEKNGVGVVAMITNNSYVDGITHRQMRKHLLETFDDIYVLNLHGDSKKKEKAPDGGKDENVFDITQGVAIGIFVRKDAKKKGLGTVYHSDLWGRRMDKFTILEASSVENVEWQKLDSPAPNYFFVPKDFGLEEEYKEGISVTELFKEYNSGIQTKRDDTTIRYSAEEVEEVVKDFLNLSPQDIKTKYNLPADGRDWRIEWAIDDLREGYTVSQICYRPFDDRWTAYTGHSKGFIAYPREKTNKEVVCRENICLLTSRTIPANQKFNRAFVTKQISDIHAASDQTYVFPLFIYEHDGAKQKPNFNGDIFTKFLKIQPKAEAMDVFDYVYAVLHSPAYRKKYGEFLKIGFPRIPCPKNREQFDLLAALGKELRELHLLESPKVHRFVTTYPEDGTNKVEKVRRDDDRMYINGTQYFAGVPDEAWSFTIGGYLPAQKWLKDRIGRVLSNDDIEHYQKIIVALIETDRIMKKIDSVLTEPTNS